MEVSISHSDRAKIQKENSVWKAEKRYWRDSQKTLQLQACRNYKGAVQKYIRDQENEDMVANQLSFKEYEDPFAHLK